MTNVLVWETLPRNGDGEGTVTTFAPGGNDLVALGAPVDGEGMVTTHAPNGKDLVGLGVTAEGNGNVTTYAPNGKELVALNATDTGGMIAVFNKTGDGVVQLRADEYGNGVVGAYNRKGKGRTLEPGP